MPSAVFAGGRAVLMPKLLCMASGIARPAGRKKSPRHEYRGPVGQFPPVRIVDGEPRCVSSRDVAGCVISRDITATIHASRVSPRPTEIFSFSLTRVGGDSSSAEDDGKRSTRNRVPGRQKGCETDTGINIYTDTKKREVEQSICSMREELTRSRLTFKLSIVGEKKFSSFFDAKQT